MLKKKWIARLVKYIFFSFSSFHSVFGQKVPSETGQILIRNEEKMTRTWCIKVWNEQNMVRIWSNLIIFWWNSDSEKKSLISFCSDLTEIFTRDIGKFLFNSLQIGFGKARCFEARSSSSPSPSIFSGFRVFRVKICMKKILIFFKFFFS